MKHNSVLKLNSPIEFIESSKISPFISKVQIKVCYVGDEPNRNRSIITKEVAKEMAPSLRGCPIVGFYNEWIGEMSESDDSWKDLMLAPFTLDCSWTYQEHLRQFYWGVAMLAVTVVVIPLLIVFIIKRDKKKAAASVPVGYGSSYNGSYSPYNGIANENYQRQNLSQGYDTYGSYNRSSGGNNQTFQTQGYKSYDPYDTYRSQANTSGDSFQAQGRQGGYNTQNNFQPQNSNSGYRDNAYGNYKNNDNGGW